MPSKNPCRKYPAVGTLPLCQHTLHVLPHFSPPPCLTKSASSLKSPSNSFAMAIRSACSPLSSIAFSLSPDSSSHVVRNPLTKVPNSLTVSFPAKLILTNRIHANLQSRSCRFCCHGLYRLLCQAHSHPNVSLIFPNLSSDTSHVHLQKQHSSVRCRHFFGCNHH
jgi:hypothetical protein